MVAQCIKVTPSPLYRASVKPSTGLSKQKNNFFTVMKFFVALSCLSVSVFFVPEAPNQFASICERHHSSAACNVW